jgi:hypothetical protein
MGGRDRPSAPRGDGDRYRYRWPGQKGCAPPPKFKIRHADLWRYFEQATERLIRETISTETADADMVKEPIGLV